MIQVVGGEVLRDKEDAATKKLTDDDRNAFAAKDVKHIMMMMLFKVWDGLPTWKNE